MTLYLEYDVEREKGSVCRRGFKVRRTPV